MGEHLSSREKGDLYWRKRIMYIASAAAKTGLREGYLNRDTADDTLDAYNDEDKMPKLLSPFPSGREFLVCPPTAAGQRYFAECVATLMHVRDYIDKILASDGSGIDEVVRSLFYDNMEMTQKLIKRVINDFFAISGLDPLGHELDEKIDRKKAIEAFKKSRAEYEKNIDNIILQSSGKMIEKLREDADQSGDDHAEASVTDEMYEKLVASDPASEILFADELNNLREMIGSVLQEISDRVQVREKLKDTLLGRYYNDDMDPVRRHVMTDAFMQYRHMVDNQLIRLLYTRQACYYYASYLITDEPVDSIINDVIREDLKKDVEVLDEGVLLSEVSGFSVVNEESAGEEKLPDDYDSIVEAGKKLREYCVMHPGKFNAQCLLSVVTDNEELGSILHKSRMLAKGIDRFTKSGAAKGIGRDKWFMLFDTWVVSYSVCSVIMPIVEFLRENEDKTVEEATANLVSLLPSISYNVIEKNSREVLRDVIFERSGRSDQYK